MTGFVVEEAAALKSLKRWAEDAKTMLRCEHGLNPDEANLVVNDVMYDWARGFHRDRDFSLRQVRAKCRHIGGEDGSCDRCGAKL